MGSPANRSGLSPLKQALLALEEMEARLAESERPRVEPIAVIGLGCRFPGADNPDAFWQLLHNGVDAVREVPSSRWKIEDYYDPNPDAPGKMSSKWGGFLDQVDRFDPEFFGISPREAVAMDPQQRLLLEVSWEALERAGQGPAQLAQCQTGVFIGMTSDEYAQLFHRQNDLNVFDTYFASGIARSVAGGRISYTLGIQGPNLSIDTACSSSLVAVHMACLHLRMGECGMALAGGSNVILSPEIGIAFSKAHMLASDGRCKAFDSRADGFVRSEGCGMVVLKRLSDAVASGDPILALIRGSAVNQDGRSSGLTVPNRAAQEAVITDALARGRVRPQEVGYIEAHGTGTELGDPIEARALANILGPGRKTENPLVVGSVKTNLGHLESASGIAGLIKAVLTLQHEEIPPILHFQKMNPHIDWGGMPVEIPVQPRPWPRGEKRRVAGVSAFGFSGTNAHVVLEEAPLETSSSREFERPRHILALSARSETALGSLGESYAELLRDTPFDLGDVCNTANSGRAHFEHRLAVTGASYEEMRTALLKALPGSRISEREGIRPVFLFPGQGAQYTGMGAELFETEPVFRRAMEECAELLKAELELPLLDVLWGPSSDTLRETAYTQPALFAIEYAIANLWRSWGVEPAAVLGHSVGEYVAACVAGVFSLADGLKLIAARARLMQSASGRGAMAAVMAGEERVREALEGIEGRVSIAAFNAPQSIVISGYEEELVIAEQRLQSGGTRVSRLSVSHAFHSPQMTEIENAFERAASQIQFAAPKLPLISSLTGEPVKREELSKPAYWSRQIRQPVRFQQAMQHLRHHRAFVEVGPGTTLAGLGRQSVEDGSVLWITSLRKDRGEWNQLLESLAQLYTRGADINWHRFDEPYRRRKVALPTYPFERKRYWLDTKPRGTQATAQATGHPLLGQSVDVAGDARLQVWQTRIRPADLPYLADHRAMGNVVFPLTGYLEMGGVAAGPTGALADIVIREPLILSSEEGAIVQTVRRGNAVEIYSLDEGEWKQHFHCQVVPVEAPSPGPNPQGRRESMERYGDIQDFYSFMRDRGMDFGPAFRAMRELWTAPAEAVARVSLTEPTARDSAVYRVHPALLDGCFQTIGAALPEGGEDLFLPMRLERFELHRSSSAELWAHAARRPGTSSKTAIFDIRIFDERGPIADARGMEFVRVAAKKPTPLFEVRWEPKQRGPAAARVDGDYLILPDQNGAGALLAEGLAEWLTARGARCKILSDPANLRTVAREREWSGVVYFSSPDGSLRTALDLVQALAATDVPHPPRLWLVTKGAQAVSQEQAHIEVGQSMLWGMAQGISQEHPEWHCTSIDLDPAGPAKNVDSLCEEIAAAGPDDQIAFRSGERLVSRIAMREMKPQLEAPLRLGITTRGVLDNLEIRPAVRRAIPPGHVEIEVHATGLNFRDVLNVLGMFTGPLGSECAGRVIGVGEGVTEFAAGDEVVAFAAGTHDGFVLADARVVARKPANLTMEQAATLPTAFLTTRYTIEGLAKIQPNDRILIHAAAGGVGLAAVQIAQRAGAQIFATAGSERKRAFLRELGVQHVMNSRTLDFAREIQDLTNGRGVDIVLNALAGDFIPASFSVLAPGGCFLEIGKRDIWTAEQAEQLGKNIRYFVADLGQVAVDDPRLVGDLLRDTVAAVERGELQPLHSAVFAFDNAVSAYRHMAQAHHIGKVVLRQSVCGAGISAKATYLITGGFGGIGTQLLRWLVTRGARNIVLVGRHGPGSQSRAAIEWAEAQGARVVTHLADIASASHVSQLLSTIAAEMPPLRGILHTAGVIEDGILTEQSWDRFERVLAPKVRGSWLLHELTESIPLDFFVMFSSIASILGAPGQANYAAANAYQDALAQERRKRGMAAISVNWGPWPEGMAGREDLETRRKHLGVETMPNEELLALLGYILADNPVQVAAARIQWSKLLRRYPKDAVPGRFALLMTGTAEATPAQEQGHAALRERLAAVPDSRRTMVLREHVQALAQRVLGFPASRQIDFQQPLNELGLDSLMAVEFRNLLAAELDLNLPSTLLFNYPALEDVSGHLAGLLFKTAAPDEPATPRTGAPGDVLDAIENLSEEDVDRLLADKLGVSNG